MSFPHIVYLPADLKTLTTRLASERIGWQGGYDNDYKQNICWNIYAISEEMFPSLIEEIRNHHTPYKVR